MTKYQTALAGTVLYFHVLEMIQKCCMLGSNSHIILRRGGSNSPNSTLGTIDDDSWRI